LIRDDLGKIARHCTIGKRYVSPQAGDCDRDVYPIGIALARVRMAGMIKVMGDTATTHAACVENEQYAKIKRQVTE
jgi:hypothetical protein